MERKRKIVWEEGLVFLPVTPMNMFAVVCKVVTEQSWTICKLVTTMQRFLLGGKG